MVLQILALQQGSSVNLVLGLQSRALLLGTQVGHYACTQSPYQHFHPAHRDCVLKDVSIPLRSAHRRSFAYRIQHLCLFRSTNQAKDILNLCNDLTRADERDMQAEPITLAGMVGALSLNGQQQPAAALHQQALELQHAQAPVHSHFRPCWAQRGAAVGLPMLPHVDQVAVEVPTEKLSRCKWISLSHSDCLCVWCKGHTSAVA